MAFMQMVAVDAISRFWVIGALATCRFLSCPAPPEMIENFQIQRRSARALWIYQPSFLRLI